VRAHLRTARKTYAIEEVSEEDAYQHSHHEHLSMMNPTQQVTFKKYENINQNIALLKTI